MERYPAVVLSSTNKERYKVLGDIYNNYILKDIKGLLELATEKNLFLLSQYLAVQIGNTAVYQNMGQVASLDYRQLRKHLNILKETFILNEASPYFKNRQKELTKNPKIYFIPTRNTPPVTIGGGGALPEYEVFRSGFPDERIGIGRSAGSRKKRNCGCDAAELHACDKV